jgi:hypothetical protein
VQGIPRTRTYISSFTAKQGMRGPYKVSGNNPLDSIAGIILLLSQRELMLPFALCNFDLFYVF